MREVTREFLKAKETRARATRLWRERVGENLARLAVLLAVLGLWHVVAARHDAALLPGPGDTYAGLVRGWSLIWTGAVDTVTEIALGFAAGVVAGLVLGSLIGQSKTLQGVLHPFLILYQAVPKIGLAPMIVLLLGFGILPKVVLAAMSALFPVLENTILGVQRVDEDGVRLFRALGASPFQTYWKFRLIHALPSIMTGVRVAVVLATVSVVVAEFVAGRIGLGATMMVGYAQLDTALVFGALVVLTLIGLAYYFGVFLIERLVLRWFNLAPPARS
ncbi:MAG TPA: ABC transporter permease [Candidatus Methylomirabilis sp.]|nr:ABC transporter permease [Candidatus Methylomirabilis sp.]